MPRVARIKNSESINYVFVKGISEISLFREDEDKEYYLSLITRFKKIYGFKLYACCIMENYAHFIIDLCGADISSIMSSINVGYSGYYNRKYKRQGHLFHDRFKSKIIKDELELKALTLYIHNSPSAFGIQPEKYKYSSLNAYCGHDDPLAILDSCTILDSVKNDNQERKNYLKLVSMYDSNKLIEEIEITSKTSNSRYYTKREVKNINADEVLDFVSERTGISKIRIQSKYVRDAKNARALTAFILKNICNFKTREISDILGELTPYSVSRLFYRGLNLVENNNGYAAIMEEIKRKYII